VKLALDLENDLESQVNFQSESQNVSSVRREEVVDKGEVRKISL